MLSNRIQQMEESATIKMAQMARNLKEQGVDVISLSLGEPDFDTPEHIKIAAKKALDEGYTKYTPVPGLLELRKAISTKFKNENDLAYDVNQIVVSNGAKQCIANICLSILNPGDEVIILAPYWVSYSSIVKISEGVPVILYAGIEQDYKVSPDQLRNAITDKTKMIIFSSPCNPTGSVYLENELRAIAKVLEEHENILVVSDEIYEHINFSGNHFSIGSIESMKNRTATVNGFSKGFSMTGWRLGYMGGPKWLAAACSKIQGQFTSGANAFGQRAGIEALTQSLSPTHEMEKAFLQRRDMMLSMLSNISGLKVNKPLGAFYIFPDVSHYFGKSSDSHTINNADDLADYLLQVAHVGLVSGSAFGAPNCIRISYAASEEQLKEAIKRLEFALSKLQ